MKKKYSVYNVNQGCEKMHTLSEAIEKLEQLSSTTEDQVGELAKIESKVQLYNDIFYGFGNTKEQKEEYKKVKEAFWASLSKTEDEEFAELVQIEIEKTYSDAMKEYEERFYSIDRRSKAGYTEDAEAYDEKKLETKKEKKYNRTNFSKLKNLAISRKYNCTDNGVYVFDEKELDYVRISDAITISNLYYDASSNQQYMELQFYDFKDKKPAKVCIPTSNLALVSFTELLKLGIIINNPKMLINYLNDLRSVDNDTDNIPKGIANMSYGYTKNPDGSTNFSNFIGIGDDNKIIPLIEYAAFDAIIFNKKGTMEGFKKFLSEVSKGKYSIVFQMLVAASLSGITQAYINNGTRLVAPPVYVFCEKTSVGKGLLATIAANIWSSFGETQLIFPSSSSDAFCPIMKHRLNYIPFIYDDLQDMIDKYGVKSATEKCFQHSLAQSGGRALQNGEIRSNFRVWNNPLIAFNESDCFSGREVTGGADARLTVININLEKGDRHITLKSPKTYLPMELENYGMMGEKYILAMRDKTPTEIMKRFTEITEELEKLGVQEKQSNSIAMLILTDELARSFGLLPDEWEALTAKRYTGWNGIKKITDPIEELHKLLSDHALGDPSYVAIDDDAFINNTLQTEEQVFTSRAKSEHAIRGRLLWQKKNKEGVWEACRKNERERTLLLIPRKELEQVCKFLCKETGLVSAGFDKARWAREGYLLKNGSEYTFKNSGDFKYGITKAYDAKARESIYAIILNEDTE